MSTVTSGVELVWFARHNNIILLYYVHKINDSYTFFACNAQTNQDDENYTNTKNNSNNCKKSVLY